MTSYFELGEAVVLRALEYGMGFAGAMSVRVVEDGPERTVLYWPAGTPGKYAGTLIPNGKLRTELPTRLEDVVWQGRDVLRLQYPDTPYSIWLLWDVPEWSLVGWYVNIESPVGRTAIGFDSKDLELDVVIRPDFSWHWKDEDHLQAVIDGGVISSEQAAMIRAAGEHAIERLERREAPFNEPWPEWRPDPGWEPLELPAGWDDVPPAVLAY